MKLLEVPFRTFDLTMLYLSTGTTGGPIGKPNGAVRSYHVSLYNKGQTHLKLPEPTATTKRTPHG